MKIELDLKTLITLAGIVAMLSGFLYTTQLRLDNLEEQIVAVEDKQERLKRRVRVKPNKSNVHQRGSKHDQKK